MTDPKHACETCVYERDSSPSQHCDSCSDMQDNWKAAEPIKCPCEAYEGLVKMLKSFRACEICAHGNKLTFEKDDEWRKYCEYCEGGDGEENNWELSEQALSEAKE